MRLLLFFLIPIQVFAQWSLVSSSSLPQGEFIDIETPSTNTAYVLNNVSELYLSTDFGSSWNLQHEFADSLSVNQILFINNDTGFATNHQYIQESLLRTYDGGLSWQSVGQPLSINNHKRFTHPSYVNDILFASYSVLGTNSIDTMFFSKSIDLGNTWEVLYFQTIDLSFFFQANITFVHSFVDAEYGYLKNNSQLQQDYLLKTTDFGETWDSIPQLNAGLAYGAKMSFMSEQLGFLYGNTTASNSKRIFVGASGYTLINPYLDQFGNLPILDIKKVDTTAFVGSLYGKIFYTSDLGFTWIEQTTPTASKINQLSFANLEHGIAITNGEILRTVNGGGLSVTDFDNENIEIIYQKSEMNLLIKTPPNEEVISSKIFNVLGQEVSSLKQGDIHNVNHLSFGSYIVVVQTDRRRVNQKINIHVF